MKKHLAKRIVISLVLSVGTLGPLAGTAQEQSPPELSSLVGEDPLMASMRPFNCPTGRNAARLTDGGYRLTVSGECREADAQASLVVPVPDLNLPDGEVRVEAHIAEGPEQARFLLWFRVQPNGDGYYLGMDAARGATALVARFGGQNIVLAERTDLVRLIRLNDWNSLAVRAQGPSVWAFINSVPVLSAIDSSYDGGAVGLGLRRLGSVSSALESTVLVRNLAVSSVAGVDESRTPLYPGPPPTGAVVVDDPLTGRGVLRDGACPTNLVSGAFVDEGFLINLRGRCSDALPRAEVVQPIRGVTLPDGEVRLDERVLSGADRSETLIGTRLQAGGGYYAAFNAGLGRARLFKAVDQQITVLAERTDLAAVLAPFAPNTLAVRAQGTRLWLLVNELPVLSAVDTGHDAGSVALLHSRLGPLDDEQESAVVMRNLRISALADGDPGRLPSYEP